MTTAIEIRTEDGTAGAFVAGQGPGVLFFMDAIGLRPQIADMADRVAGWGYTVLAPNAFYRSGTVAELAPTTDLRVPENRAAFVFGHAARDGSMPPEDVARLDDALAATGLPFRNETYDGPHGYTMADTSSYDEASAERHFAELEELLRRTLR